MVVVYAVWSSLRMRTLLRWAYTKVACKLLDCKTARCSDYPKPPATGAWLYPAHTRTLADHFMAASKLCLPSLKGWEKPALLALPEHRLTPECDQGEEIGRWTLYFRRWSRSGTDWGLYCAGCVKPKFMVGIDKANISTALYCWSP